MNSPEFYMSITFTSGIIAIIAAFFTYRMSRFRDYSIITALFIFSGIWAIMDGYGVLAPTLQGKVVAATLAYFGIAFIPPGILMTALIQTNQIHRVPKTLILVIWGFAVLYLVTVLTNPIHQLYWDRFEWVDYPFPNNLLFHRGPVYSIFIGVSYLFLAGGVFVLLSNLTYTRGVLQLQTIGMLVSILLPWMGHIYWLYRNPATNEWDFTSTLLIITVGLMLVNLKVWGMFDLLPIVRDEIPEMIADGIVVVDDHERVIYLNDAASNMIDSPKNKLIGKKFDILPIDQVAPLNHSDGKKLFIQTKIFGIDRRRKLNNVKVIMLIDVTQNVLDEEKIKGLEQEKVISEARKRIADDLHDAMAQGLYSLRLLTEEVRRRQSELLPIDDVVNMIDQAVQYSISEFRMTLFKLNDISTHLSLCEFIEQRLSSVEQRVGIETNFQCSSLPILSDEELEQCTSFISEALNNVLIHARAKAIELTVQYENSELTIIVADDGIGFDPSISRPGHLGISNMRHRAESHKGSVNFNSSHNGTVVSMVFRPSAGG